jgi:hypothetical protein
MVVINKRIISDKEEIWLDDKKILRIKVNDGFDFDEKDMLRQFDAYKQLVGGKRAIRPVLVEAPGDFAMDKDARELAARTTRHYFNACAIISRSLATRIIVNFLNSFYQFGFPIRMFNSEQQAMEWLEQYM